MMTTSTLAVDPDIAFLFPQAKSNIQALLFYQFKIHSICELYNVARLKNI